MAPKYFADEVRHVARTLVERLVTARKEPSGWTYSTIFLLEKYSLERLAACPYDMRGAIMKALGKIPKAFKGDMLSELERQLRVVTAELKQAQARQITLWTLWCPLANQIEEGSPQYARLRLLGLPIIITSATRAHSLYSSLLQRAPEHRVRWYANGHPGSFVIVRCQSWSSDDAWRQTDVVVETLRGILEFYIGYGSLRWAGTPSPRRNLEPLDFALAASRGAPTEVLSLFYPSTSHATKERFPKKLSLAIIPRIASDLSGMSQAPRATDIGSMIAHAFRLYCQALDQPFDYAQFLSLWQLAEAITLVRPGRLKDRAVAVRLAWFQSRWMDYEPTGVVDTLLRMERLRNRLVHAAESADIGDDDVNVLKFLCETALSRLMSLKDRLATTEALDAFYGLIEQPEARRAADGAAMRILDELHKPT